MHIPLSYSWFKSDKKLFERFNTIWLTTEGLGNRFEGNSGEGVYHIDYLRDIKKELLYLREFVTQTTAYSSPEAKWLQSLNQEYLSKIKLFIFISDRTWEVNSTIRYAENIAIENSFGSLRLPPILSVIIHELTVNSNHFLEFAHSERIDEPGKQLDSHIQEDYTMNTWNYVNSIGFNSISENQNYIDHLYQSHRAYSAIGLAILISKIKDI